jgi:type IV secretory pathway VirD2 relaxase
MSLATAVLDALERRDRATLASLALTEQEFGTRVWPELPAARPERNLPLSFVWADLSQKSQSSLAELLAQHGGRRYSLVSVGFAGETTKYTTFAVHRKSELTLKTAEGTELQLRLFGSVIEVDGTFKVFSYVVD